MSPHESDIDPDAPVGEPGTLPEGAPTPHLDLEGTPDPDPVPENQDGTANEPDDDPDNPVSVDEPA